MPWPLTCAPQPHGFGQRLAAAPQAVPHSDMAQKGLAYRPELDGVRGVGMALILWYHLTQVVQGHALGTPAGGWIGLDLFFVLSGLLITQLLLKEWYREAAINLRHFYARRAARLAPALIVLLAAQVIATSLAGTAATRRQLPGSLAWVLSQLGNFGLLAGGFIGKLDHTWSLAIEEQFYLIWPILLVTALKAGWSRQRLRHWLGVAIVVLAVAGLVASLSGVGADVTYFATPFRANEILVGCWAALGSKPASARPLVREGALLTLLAVVCVLPQNSRLLADGGYTLIAICAALVMTQAPRPWWGHRVLSVPPLVALGRISYSVYLWHWPTYYAVRFAVGVDRPISFVVAPVMAIALAVLSSRYVELPYRRAAEFRNVTVPVPTVLIPAAQLAVVGVAAAAIGFQVIPSLVVTAAGAVILGAVALTWRGGRQPADPEGSLLVRHELYPRRSS